MINLKSKYFIFISSAFILIFLFEYISDLTIWGTLKKIITYENSLSAREYILDFKLPLISFNQNLGFPLLAESQAGIFQPINLFFNLIFGPLKQINYSIYFHLLLWSSSIYFLLTKIYNVDKNISIYSSIIALISPLIITDLTHQFSLQTFSYLPLSLFIVEKFLINENKRYIFLILLTFCVLFMLLAGNFVYQIVAFSYLFIYTVAAIILTEHSIKNVFIKLLLFILALFLGFLLASFQLIPTFELMQMGSRSDFGDSAYVGSLRPEGFGFFYKSISNDVHKVPGAIGTLGYISIFIYFFHRLFKYFSLKKIDNNKHITQILISSVIVFSISLGKFNPLNDYIYKLVPFLDSMRYPRRWMQVNGLSTILLSAICMNELSKINFKLNKLKTIILCIFLIFLFVLIINIPLLKLLNKNILSLNFLFYLLYPLILIIFSYFIIKLFLTKIIKFFFLISFLELLIFNFTLPTYTLILKKNEISDAINLSTEYCNKFNTTSLNFVGEYKENEPMYLTDTFKNSWKSPLSSNYCKVFYHHERTDIVSHGLGYNPSSLATFAMRDISAYQKLYLKEKFSDYEMNKSRYISSLNRYFFDSKSFYIDNDIAKDNYVDFSLFEIRDFINGYNYTKRNTFFQSLEEKYGLKVVSFLNRFNLISIFPSVNINKITKIQMLNKIFIPIWQSDSYYLNLNNKILKLEKYSFGHLLPNKIGIGDIYYAPLSFIIGFFITLFVSIFLFLFSIIRLFNFYLKK